MLFVVVQALSDPTHELVTAMRSRRLSSEVQEPDCIRSNIPRIPLSTSTTPSAMLHRHTFHKRNMPSTNVPKSAAPRSSFYAGCTRDELVSILYPFGRESTATIGPSLSASHRTDSKRNRLGGLVRSVTGLFRKDKTDKFKGTAPTTARPLSSVIGLRSSGVMFDASEEFDRFECQAIAGLERGSDSADALNELIEVHSDRESGSNLGSDDFSSLSDILAKFPAVPASSSPAAPRVGRPGCSSDISDGFVVGGRIVSVDRSAGSRQDSISNDTRPSVAPSVSFFERRPSSGEFNRIDVFKRVSAVIQKRRIRPLRLMSKVEESTAPGPSEVDPAPETHSIQESPAATLLLMPDLVVTNYDDSTTIVVSLDEYEEPTDQVVPGFLFPGYVRRHYPGDGQLVGPPRLALSTSGWNISLLAIDEEAEEMVDSYLSDDDSEPDLELASDSGSSSPGSTPPTTPTFVDTPLLVPTAVGVSSEHTPAKNWMAVDNIRDGSRDGAVGIAL